MPKLRSRRKGGAAAVALGHLSGETCPFIWRSLGGDMGPDDVMAFLIVDADELESITRQFRRSYPAAPPPVAALVALRAAGPGGAAAAATVARAWAGGR